MNNNIIRFPVERTAAAPAVPSLMDLILREKLRRAEQERELIMNTQRAAEKVAELNQVAADPEIPPVEAVDGGGYYDGWKGGKAGTWHSDQELKQLILADFKRAGIKATIRFNRAGYLTSLTVTIRMSADAVKPFEAFHDPAWCPGDGWYSYTDDDGNYREIHGSAFWALCEAERAALLPRIERYRYDAALRSLQSASSHHPDEEKLLTDEARKVYDKARAIVTSYNRDQSNSQIDYFDRDIYDHYCVKLV
jgi:hypothetical protein